MRWRIVLCSFLLIEIMWQVESKNALMFSVNKKVANAFIMRYHKYTSGSA